jgi:hypothetical protein
MIGTGGVGSHWIALEKRNDEGENGKMVFSIETPERSGNAQSKTGLKNKVKEIK